MKCPKCGTPADGDLHTCPQCNADLPKEAPILKKKTLMLAAVTIAVILIVVLVVVLRPSGKDTATGIQEVTEPTETDPVLTEPTAPQSETTQAAEQALSTFLNAYCTGDAATAGAILEGLGQPLAMDGFGGFLAENTQMHVLWPVTDEENRVVFRVCVETVDMEQVIASVPQDVASAEEASQSLEQILASEDLPRKVFYPEVTMQLRNEEWRLSMNQNFSNALTGGLTNLLAEMARQEEAQWQ